MNPLTQIKNTQKATKREIEEGFSESASWHARFKHSAYIFAGGLAYDLTEGDLLAVFSQYGEIVDINLVRDKETGKSKGFAFLAYEDQRSTVLALDNLSGARVSKRIISVNHVDNYRLKRAEVEGREPSPEPQDELRSGPDQRVKSAEELLENRQDTRDAAEPSFLQPNSVFALLSAATSHKRNKPEDNEIVAHHPKKDKKDKKDKKMKRDKKDKKAKKAEGIKPAAEAGNSSGAVPEEPAGLLTQPATVGPPRPSAAVGPPRPPAVGPARPASLVGPARPLAASSGRDKLQEQSDYERDSRQPLGQLVGSTARAERESREEARGGGGSGHQGARKDGERHRTREAGSEQRRGDRERRNGERSREREQR